MKTKSTYYITGASRGIGLEFVRQLVLKSTFNYIIAAVRSPSSATALYSLQLEYPNQIEIIKFDVSSPSSIQSVVKELESKGIKSIDVLINNAGILAGGWVNALEGTIEDLQSNLDVNLFGVIRTCQALMPLLREGEGKKIWCISSLSGSIGGILSEGGFATPYCISKAALNMYLKKLSRDLKPEKFTIIPIHPGYVKTEMNGGENGGAEIYADESVEKMLKVLELLTYEESGKFYNYTGEIIVW